MSSASQSSPGRPRIDRARVLASLAPFALIALFFVLDLPMCGTRIMFGIPCPGCGLTRATIAMVQLDFAGVWHFHPLAPIVAPLFGWVTLRPLLDELGVTTRDKVYIRAPGALLVLLLVTFFAVYIARLAGFLGGHPDPIDPSSGLMGHLLMPLLPE